MRSFAIWYTLKNSVNIRSQENHEAEIHVNLFKAEDNDKVKIDFGIFVDDIEEIQSISLYCPFEIEDVFDLGELIKDKLLKGIFNENYVDKSGVPKRNYVEDLNREVNEEVNKDKHSNSRTPFFVYKLSDSEITKEKISKDEKHSGTIVVINTETILDGKKKLSESMKKTNKYYFRVRILAHVDSFKAISYSYDGVKYLEAVLGKTEVIDFRINDTRSLCDEIIDEFYKKKEFSVRAIHYLILRDARDEFVYHGKQAVNTRLLEDEIWCKYFQYNKNNKTTTSKNYSLIAYHFKKIKEKDTYVEDFIVLSKFRSNEAGVKKYIIFTVFISCLCSIIASYIYSKVMLC